MLYAVACFCGMFDEKHPSKHHYPLSVPTLIQWHYLKQKLRAKQVDRELIEDIEEFVTFVIDLNV